MRFSLAVALLAASISAGAAFAPVQPFKAVQQQRSFAFFSTVEADAETAVEKAATPASASAGALTGSEIASRLEKQLTKLSAKDAKSPQLSKEVS